MYKLFCENFFRMSFDACNMSNYITYLKVFGGTDDSETESDGNFNRNSKSIFCHSIEFLDFVAVEMTETKSCNNCQLLFSSYMDERDTILKLLSGLDLTSSIYKNAVKYSAIAELYIRRLQQIDEIFLKYLFVPSLSGGYCPIYISYCNFTFKLFIVTVDSQGSAQKNDQAEKVFSSYLEERKILLKSLGFIENPAVLSSIIDRLHQIDSLIIKFSHPK